MIPKSGNRFSGKNMLKQKVKATSPFNLESFRFVMMAHCGADSGAHRAAADRRVRYGA